MLNCLSFSIEIPLSKLRPCITILFPVLNYLYLKILEEYSLGILCTKLGKIDCIHIQRYLLINCLCLAIKIAALLSLSPYDAFCYFISLTSFLNSTLNRSCYVTYSSVAFVVKCVYCSGLLWIFFRHKLTVIDISETRAFAIWLKTPMRW